MLCPFGQVLRGDDAENVAALKPRPLPGIQLCAVTGRAAAVGVCAGAAGTQLELAGGVAVFPAQHLRLYHHDFPVQIILMGNGDAALRRDGAVVYALYAGLVEFYVGFLRLLGNPLAEQLHNLREIITGHHFAVFCK